MPGSTRIRSPLLAASTAAWIFLIVRVGPTFQTNPPGAPTVRVRPVRVVFPVPAGGRARLTVSSPPELASRLLRTGPFVTVTGIDSFVHATALAGRGEPPPLT